MAPNPNPQVRASISAKLEQLIQYDFTIYLQDQTDTISADADIYDRAIKEHEQWAPPSPNQTLSFVWDFLMRSKYMLSEYDNILNGRPLQYPDQFRPAPGAGEQAAQRVFDDVCDRSLMAKIIIDDASGKLTGTPVDFGPNCKQKVEELVQITR